MHDGRRDRTKMGGRRGTGCEMEGRGGGEEYQQSIHNLNGVSVCWLRIPVEPLARAVKKTMRFSGDRLGEGRNKLFSLLAVLSAGGESPVRRPGVPPATRDTKLTTSLCYSCGLCGSWQLYPCTEEGSHASKGVVGCRITASYQQPGHLPDLHLIVDAESPHLQDAGSGLVSQGSEAVLSAFTLSSRGGAEELL